MRMYLSSEQLGNHTDQLLSLWPDNNRVGVIANAVDGEAPEVRQEHLDDQFRQLAALGLEPEEINLTEYFDRPGRDVAERVSQNYGGLWVPGGNVFVLRQAMARSGLDHRMERLLTQTERTGLVYAGYSAGSCQVADSLRGLELVDDPTEVPSKYHAMRIFRGLELMRALVVPHFESPDNPLSPAIDDVVESLQSRGAPYLTLHDGDVVVIRDGSQTIHTDTPH
jgi:dipeptidase E